MLVPCFSIPELPWWKRVLRKLPIVGKYLFRVKCNFTTLTFPYVRGPIPELSIDDLVNVQSMTVTNNDLWSKNN